MAIAIVTAFHRPSPRHTAAAPATRVLPRVYTPYPIRRLTRPMAVRADADTASAASGRTRLPWLRGRRATLS
jgi:hypothetical protein